VAIALVVAACAETTRYRVMSFFLDGVPQPGAAPTPASAALTPAPAGILPEPAARTTATRLIPHTPYRENRCDGCHDAEGGQLIRPVQEGLCLTCHGVLVSGRAFVHGPVAVNDCTVCHHYHAAPFPNLLLADVRETCLMCHDRADLSSGDHHAAIDERSCTECHDPHGGDNRFFVRGEFP
jgi:predicted CXXCH cytochrome family protein